MISGILNLSLKPLSVDVRAAAVADAPRARPGPGAVLLDADAAARAAAEAGEADARLHLRGGDHRWPGARNSNDHEAAGTLFSAVANLFRINLLHGMCSKYRA